MAARETLQAMLALPAPVGKAILGYLGLFRPDKRALSWRKAKRIVDELAALIAPGHVQLQGKPSRPCPPMLWAMAMEQMAARGDLQRPLPNHNYLRKVVWKLADQADSGREQAQRRAEVDGTQRVVRKPSDFHKLGTEFNSVPQEVNVEDGMSEIMRKLLRQQGEDHA